jgi:hypothetical protein
MALHLIAWKWYQPGFRDRYTGVHVKVVHDMLAKHAKGLDYRFLCITDDASDVPTGIETAPLWKEGSDLKNASGENLPSCYRRLKLFDPDTQKKLGIKEGDRVAWIDLDSAVVGPIAPVFNRTERFMGWGVRGTHHLRVFNGSMVMFTAGDLADVWKDFRPDVSPKTAHSAGFLGSDQAWLSYKLARRTDCHGWSWPQVVSFPREMRRRERLLPTGASIIFFHGRRKPWMLEVQSQAPWLKNCWGPNQTGAAYALNQAAAVG